MQYERTHSSVCIYNMVSAYTYFSKDIQFYTSPKWPCCNTVHDIWLSEVLPLTLVWRQLNRAHNCDTWISGWINQHQFWHISRLHHFQNGQYKNLFINQSTWSVIKSVSSEADKKCWTFLYDRMTRWDVNEDWLYSQCKMPTSILYEVGRILLASFGEFFSHDSACPQTYKEITKIITTVNSTMTNQSRTQCPDCVIRFELSEELRSLSSNNRTRLHLCCMFC